MKVELLDQLADCNSVVMLVPLASTLLVAANLQLWGEKRPVLVSVSCIVFFIQRAIVSLEAPLYGMTVIKNNAVSYDRDSLISKYCTNVETGHNFGFWRNTLKTSGFSLNDCPECFNTSSNTNIHYVSFR